MFIDSHCHLNMLDLAPFGNDLQKVFDHAHSLKVSQFLSVAVTLDDHHDLTTISEQYPNVYISTGLHPNENPGESLNIDLLNQQAQHPKVIAIGETGLDYYRSDQKTQWQEARFVQHMECARNMKKPLIIHTRNAPEDTLKIMRDNNAQDIKGVMHCFTENLAMAEQCIDLGFYISFSGIVTFKNATQIQEVAKNIPLECMLIETDCPYLAPVPHRGKPNLPGYVAHVAEYIAQLRNVSVETIGQVTSDNFKKLFGIG